MADEQKKALQEQLMSAIREKQQAHNKLMQLIGKNDTNRSARERVIAWNELKARMMQLDEQIRLIRQRIAQDEE